MRHSGLGHLFRADLASEALQAPTAEQPETEALVEGRLGGDGTEQEVMPPLSAPPLPPTCSGDLELLEASMQALQLLPGKLLGPDLASHSTPCSALQGGP